MAKEYKNLPKVATGGKFDNILNEKELVADVSNFSCLLPIILYEVEMAAAISYVIPLLQQRRSLESTSFKQDCASPRHRRSSAECFATTLHR